MNTKLVEIGVVDSIKASAKVLKAIHHNATVDTINGYLCEASSSLRSAMEAMDLKDDILDDVIDTKDIPSLTDIPTDEIKEAKIRAIVDSIFNGETTIDDWNICPSERDVIEKNLRKSGLDLYGDELVDEEEADDEETEAEESEYDEDSLESKDDSIVDDTPDSEYSHNEKVAILKLIECGKLVRKVARSVNRHFDNGDFKPNKEKLRKMNKDFIAKLNQIRDEFANNNRTTLVSFANHLIEAATNLRKIRFDDKLAMTKFAVVKRLVRGDKIAD